MTMPQCVAPTIRTTRMSVSCARMPASNSLTYTSCQKEPVLRVGTFALQHPHRYIHKATRTYMLTEQQHTQNTYTHHTPSVDIKYSDHRDANNRGSMHICSTDVKRAKGHNAIVELGWWECKPHAVCTLYMERFKFQDPKIIINNICKYL